MKNLSFLLLGFIFLAVSCERGGKNENTGETSTKADKVKIELDSSFISLNTVWKAMIQSDDQKIADIKRLLLEVSYTDSYDVVLYDSAMSLQKKLPTKRYDQVSMGDSKKIDLYDNATDSLIQITRKVASTAKNIDSHPIANQLVNDIMEGDSKLLQYRIEYDYWAKRYNKCLGDNQKQIEKLGAPYTNYAPMPLFQLEQ